MQFKKSLFVIAILSSITACGGGSSDTSSVQPPNGGSTPPTVGTTGVITGFGSVIVNGVHYSTSSATVSTDDKDSGTENDLAVGMVVDVAGTLSSDGTSGTASSIRYAAHVEGPISLIDLAANQLTVLGQVIDFDDLTVFEGVTAATLNINDRVEISGYYKNPGQFYASRIERDSKPSQLLKVYGVVAELNTTAQTFKLGSQLIDYSKARLDDFGSQQLANGQTVKVKGSSVDANSKALLATEIDLKTKPTSQPDKLRTEGTVANLIADTSFELNGVKLLLSATTVFENGAKAELVNGALVKVQASNSIDGWKVDKVVFIKAIVSKVEGKVTAVNTTENTFTVGTETYLVTPQTVFKDDSARQIRFFELSSLTINDYVEVVGFKNPQGRLVALKVERENGASADGYIELKGLPSEVAAESFTLFGKKVIVDSNTVFLNGRRSLSQSAFFSLLKTTTVVEVKATAAGADLLATRLKIETSGSNDGAVETEFKGSISEIGADFIVVGSKKVLLSANIKLRIGDKRDYTLADFLKDIKVGDTAEVEGTIDASSGAIKARSVSIERESD